MEVRLRRKSLNDESVTFVVSVLAIIIGMVEIITKGRSLSASF